MFPVPRGENAKVQVVDMFTCLPPQQSKEMNSRFQVVEQQQLGPASTTDVYVKIGWQRHDTSLMG